MGMAFFPMGERSKDEETRYLELYYIPSKHSSLNYFCGLKAHHQVEHMNKKNTHTHTQFI